MSKRKSQLDEIYFDTVVIPAGNTISSVLDLGNHTLCGVQIPAGMTGTSLAVHGAMKKYTLVPVKNTAGDVLALVIDNTASVTAISPQETAPVRFIKLMSNDTEIAERVITIISIRAAEGE